GRIVKSRYLQYDKKETKKDTSANSFSTSVTKTSSAAKPRSALSQKCKTSAGGVTCSLNQSSFEKGDLQSTLLGEDKISRPDLDLSAINDKTVRKKTPVSKSAHIGDTKTRQKSKAAGRNSDALEELESQTLLLTYLRVKAGKNLAELEEKAEKNLLMLCEEKERQQKKLCELKHEILLKEREQKLDDALDKQMEVLSPLVPVCEQFKDQYKSFAVSLDATRHQLPIKNIHIEGDVLTYLDELQKQLTITQELLAEVMPSSLEESAKAFNVLKDLKEVSQKLDKELQRSFTEVQNLSFEVSKEVSLHNQRICEENHGLDVVKHWYFN
ncbi:PREDICTED: HAUS augmin-like complex subunit 8, partial [Leptosomus discolor]|uniref:HAUS augmin-like complex subunit 8 n=1 Tax=Leptosomus discolor TaxID=188344 RepID=UPI000522A775